MDNQEESSTPSLQQPAMEDSSSLSFSDTQTPVDENNDDTLPQVADQSHVSQFPKDSQDLVQEHDPESTISEADLFSTDESIEDKQLSKLQV